MVICTHCRKEFSFHRSTSTLKYHLNAKHVFAGAPTSGATPSLRQNTLTERRALSKSTSDKLTDTIATWIAKDYRPINIVRELYEAKKKTKEEDLASADYVALTGDHWTSVSNNNYLSVTAHHITKTWELKSFVLTVMKTEERHFAEACAEQFETVAGKWAIDGKIKSNL